MLDGYLHCSVLLSIVTNERITLITEILLCIKFKCEYKKYVRVTGHWLVKHI